MFTHSFYRWAFSWHFLTIIRDGTLFFKVSSHFPPNNRKTSKWCIFNWRDNGVRYGIESTNGCLCEPKSLNVRLLSLFLSLFLVAEFLSIPILMAFVHPRAFNGHERGYFRHEVTNRYRLQPFKIKSSKKVRPKRVLSLSQFTMSLIVYREHSNN